MSHTKERSEKVCLNCGATLQGRYCHVCGQENVEPSESVGHLIRHFFEDMTHFDGKFFTTLKFLITKPGFLTAEYLAGRRARYLHPVRMYMFISFIFFFILLTFFKSGVPIKENTEVIPINQGKDSTINYTYKAPGIALSTNHKAGIPTSKTLAEYQAGQDSLPQGKRDNTIVHYFMKKVYTASDAVEKKDPKELIDRFTENLLHSIPQMLFVVLPFFALILSLLYFRRRKNYNYVAHAIFTIHFYCFAFICWFLILLSGLVPVIGFIASPLLFLTILVYLYIAMRKFYQQGKLKTFIKFMLLNFMLSILFSIIAIAYILTAIIKAAS